MPKPTPSAAPPARSKKRIAPLLGLLFLVAILVIWTSWPNEEAPLSDTSQAGAATPVDSVDPVVQAEHVAVDVPPPPATDRTAVDPEAAFPDDGAWHFRTLSHSGDVLAGVRVTLVQASYYFTTEPGQSASWEIPAEAPKRSALSDAAGSCSIEALAQDNLPIIEWSADGFSLERRRLNQLEVQQARGIDGLALRLMPISRLEARVLNEEGQAIPHAEISINSASDNPQPIQARLTTDAQGFGVFLSPPQLAAHARASAQGYVDEHHDLPPNWQDVPLSRVEFVLEKGTTVQGKVVDTEGKPVVGAQVWACWIMRDHWHDENGERINWGERLPSKVMVDYFPKSMSSSALTDADGQFSISSLDFDRDIHVLAQQGTRSVLGFVVNAEDRLTLTIPPPASLRFRVELPDGSAASHASVLGDRVALPQSPCEFRVEADVEGRVVLESSAGPHSFFAQLDEFVGERDLSDVPQASEPVLQLMRGAELELLAGEGWHALPPELDLALYRPQQREDRRAGFKFSLDQNRVRSVNPRREVITGLFPGPALLSMRLPGYESTLLPVDLVAGERTSLEIPLSAFPIKSSAIVEVRSSEGQPIPRCEISLLPVEQGLEKRFRRTDANGKVFIEGLVPGPWTLVGQTRHAGEGMTVTVRKAVEIEAGENNLILELPPLASLIVELGPGAPETVGGSLGIMKIGSTDGGRTVPTLPGQREVEFLHIPTRRVLLSWGAPGFGARSTEVDLQPGLNRARLSAEEGHALFRIETVDGAPISGAALVATYKPRSTDKPHRWCLRPSLELPTIFSIGTGSMGALSESDGLVRLHDLVQERYWASAVAEGYQVVGPIPFDPSENPTTPVVIQLARAGALKVILERSKSVAADGERPTDYYFALTDAAGHTTWGKKQDDGSRLFEGLAQGQAQLVVHTRDNTIVVDKSIEIVAGNQPTEVTVRPEGE